MTLLLMLLMMMNTTDLSFMCAGLSNTESGETVYQGADLLTFVHSAQFSRRALLARLDSTETSTCLASVLFRCVPDNDTDTSSTSNDLVPEFAEPVISDCPTHIVIATPLAVCSWPPNNTHNTQHTTRAHCMHNHSAESA